MITKKKIGLGIVTHNREEYCKQVTNKIPSGVFDSIILVNDATPYSTPYPDHFNKIVVNEKNLGVGKSKNICFRYLMEQNCDYIFLLEDDILINNITVIEKYIRLHEVTGIHHFNFAYHGPANKHNGKCIFKQGLIYNHDKDDIGLVLVPNVVGAFSFYTRECLMRVGLMNEVFVNACEHVHHTLEIIRAGMHPPFWWFADLMNSHEYISEIACSEVSSVIRKDDWLNHTRKSFNMMRQLTGIDIFTLSKTNLPEVIKSLAKLKPK